MRGIPHSVLHMSDNTRKLILLFAVVGAAPSCVVAYFLLSDYLVLSASTVTSYRPVLIHYGLPCSILNYVISRLLVRFECLEENNDTAQSRVLFVLLPAALAVIGPLIVGMLTNAAPFGS